MLAHPILIERPIDVTPRGVRLCRPAETVLDLLPPQQAPISTEDGLPMIDERGPARVGGVSAPPLPQSCANSSAGEGVGALALNPSARSHESFPLRSPH